MILSLPAAFEKQIRADLGDESDRFLESLRLPSPVSIRYNILKKAAQNVDLEQVAWCKDGYYLSERPIFTLDPAFHAGAYYVQEASSMFVAEAVRQTIDLERDVVGIDLCAAPGGKTTLLASLLSKHSLLLANEVIKSRVEVLKENVTKFGLSNTIICNHEVENLEKLAGFFDFVLADAPCSGEGLFRKDAAAAGEWSPEAVQHCAARQRRILSEAAKLLKQDGVFLYSTCTYNDAENSENVAWLIQEFDFELIRLQLPVEWNIVEKTHGYQFYPHRTKGEGFFLSALRKKSASAEIIIPKNLKFSNLQKLPQAQVEILKPYFLFPDEFSFFLKHNQEIVAVCTSQISNIQLIDAALQRKSLGLEIGSFKGKDFIPSHALALSVEIHPDLHSVELDKATALKFLKKEEIAPTNAPKGWLLVRYEGLNLGWIKNLGNRSNNYLPKEFKIRMNI